jgi:hypothetical protein
MSKTNCRRSGKDRRASGRPREWAVMNLPGYDKQRMIDEVAYLVHHLDGAKEYFEEALSKLQADGYFIVAKSER